jgi:hypothetical protein
MVGMTALEAAVSLPTVVFLCSPLFFFFLSITALGKP